MQPVPADIQVDVIDGVEYARSSLWTKKLEKEHHWRSYWWQQHLMDDLIRPGDSLLEIGPGSGFTTNYLRSKQFNVCTMDFDPGKNPDIVANIVQYDFPNAYDAIMAFEVFEHIPFDKFRESLPRIAAACRRYLFFSVPRCVKTAFAFELKLPKLRPFRWAFRVNRGRPMSRYHYWEIDYNGVKFDDVTRAVAECGLTVERHMEAQEQVFFACRRS